MKIRVEYIPGEYPLGTEDGVTYVICLNGGQR